MSPVGAPAPADLHWLGEFSLPVERLAMLAQRDCAAFELLQFARAPFAAQIEGRWVIGDLRFDREAGLGMAEIRLGATPDARCGHSVPWVPPRASLLSVSE